MAGLRATACAGLATPFIMLIATGAQAQTLNDNPFPPRPLSASSDTLSTLPGEETEGQESETVQENASTNTLAGEEETALTEDGLNLRTTPESRLNRPASTVDPRTTSGTRSQDSGLGIRVGTFILTPSLRQSLGHEKIRSGGTTSNRTFSETELKGSLKSDWSRHQLTVTGTGTYEKTITRTGVNDPSWSLDAELRLDVTRDTTVTLNGGYKFAHESATDPNSVSGASTQSGVHTYSGGIKAEQNFGRLKGSLSLNASRTVYGPASFANGTTLSQAERNANSGELTLRLGYEVSPAISPFVEASLSRSYYDRATDSAGYARDSSGWGLRAGIESDLGEKLKGEISAGYEKADFRDSRLASIAAITVDGSLTWSPRRGTDVTLGIASNINPSTTAGTSGYVSRAFTASLSQEVTNRLIARLTAGVTDNRYSAANASANMTSWTAGAGLTWRINRYLDATGDFNWQYDKYVSGSDYRSTSFMAGLTLKR